MTQRQKLDKILYGLMYHQFKRYEDDTDYSILTFEYICSVLLKDDDIEPWEIAYYKDFLTKDGYVEIVDNAGCSIPNITHKGKKFILDGGYQKDFERNNLQEELIKTTIKSNNRSKWALITSIIAIIVTIAAIIYNK